MDRSPGSRIGPYEVIAKLGEGGMGEVYRATDTKLKRQVAIKILPESWARDSERLARFRREAEVLASLNHPHIAAIYGFEDAGETRALVMELVEGEDLSEKLKGRSEKGEGLPLDEALPIAKQIAEALEAAHDEGVVHRDLKPANIKVRPDGTVKVLDFGLAKALDQAAGSGLQASVSMSPTITTPAMTQAGMILGTAAYMSPEQARGKRIDRRTDVWAFGCVLYEMLTGTRAFAGDEVSDVLASVLAREPDWNRLPATLPPALATFLKRCLYKNPKQRVADMQDVRLALEGAFDVAPTQTVVQPAAPAPPARGARLPWIVAAATAFAAAALAVPAVRYALETTAEVRAVSTDLLPPEGTEFSFDSPLAIPAISPDGTRIVFGAKGKDGKTELWLRRLDSPTSQTLPGTENATTPFWSPDSRWVAFGQDLKLKKIDVQSGPPVAVTDLSGPLRGGSWSPQGVILFSVNEPAGTIKRVAAAGGTATAATSLEKGQERFVHRSPWFLPDGRHFLYITVNNGDMPVTVGSLDDAGTPGKVVAQSHSSVAYAQGHLLYSRENILMAQPFDPNRLETTGEAVAVAEGIPTITNPSRLNYSAVSASGLLVYLAGAGDGQSRLVWKDREGKVLGTLGEPTGRIGNVELSPDGKRAAVSALNRTPPTEDIWIYDVERGIPTKVTFDPNTDRTPAWSPDGETIYFVSNRKRPFDVYRKASNSSGTDEVVFEDSQPKTDITLSPDGKLLLFASRTDLYVLPSNRPRDDQKVELRLFLQAPGLQYFGRFSPDGQWVLYVSSESGQNQVYAAAFPGPGGKHIISSVGGDKPRWSRNGKEIFYVTADGQLMAVKVAARNGSLEVGAAQKLFDGLVTARGSTYDVSADPQKFLVVDDGVAEARPLTLLQNWTATLQR